MSHDLRKSSAEKRAEKEIIHQDRQRRYAHMEHDKRHDEAEKHFRHNPYRRMK